jgi:hypothetical protein
MTQPGSRDQCDHTKRVYPYVLRTLTDAETAAMESHIAECNQCRYEFETLEPIVASFVSWPSAERPRSLWLRLARKVASHTAPLPAARLPPTFTQPDWKQVGDGIHCRLLSTDIEHQRISMLVKLAPGATYPSHTHAGVEELYLLDGMLMIDDRLLYPGDYNRAEPGTSDTRVWSATGCMCVLITSISDLLR